MMHPNSQSGFSLVETLVAITILLVVIVGPMTIISTSANSTSFASEQVVAFFLAQEGAELAQKARDDLILNGFLPDSESNSNPAPYASFWAEFSDEGPTGTFEDCFDLNVGCGLEISENLDGAIETPVTVCTGTRCQLRYDASATNVRSRYTYVDSSNTTLTDYTRTIFFENMNNREIKVISRVQWFNGSILAPQQVEVETYLFDVYGK